MHSRELATQLIEDSRSLEGGHALGGRALARAVKEIAALEIREGGPYAPVPGGRTPDFGLNIAIARFLACCGVQLPNLDSYIREARKEKATASSVLEDAAVVECIKNYEASVKRANTRKPAPPVSFTSAERAVVRRIHVLARRRFRDVPEALRATAIAAMEKTIRGNPDKQMSLMALYMRQALGKRGARFGLRQVAESGLSNIFFWTAFIIYDDFWDEDEAASPQLLPAANLFARHYVDYFDQLLPEKTGFRTFFHRLMDQLDAANAWEIRCCRARVEENVFFIPEKLPAYRDFDIKFYPAAGHILGPVAMLVQLGYGVRSQEVRRLIAYFKHYLVAMQLNDDAHDWKEDLARGHISTAVSLLLRRWLRSHPKRRTIHLVNDLPELERLFWFEVLKPLCRSVLSRTDRSRAALRSLGMLEDPLPLERFIGRNEAVAREALENAQQSRDFLRAFASRG